VNEKYAAIFKGLKSIKVKCVKPVPFIFCPKGFPIAWYTPGEGEKESIERALRNLNEPCGIHPRYDGPYKRRIRCDESQS
jgi:hypothetical protein